MYYVKKSKDSEIEGPFTIQEINHLVKQKRFRFSSLAIAQNGLDLAEVRNEPHNRWRKLADIQGFEPDPEEERRFLLLVAGVVVALVAGLVFGLIKLAGILHRIQ